VLAGFQAEPNDIDVFIANSRSIDQSNFILRQVADSNEVPNWWPLNEAGRLYRFRHGDISGVVAVHDDSNTLCISACYIENTFSRDVKIVTENLKEGYEDFIDLIADAIREVKGVFGD